MKRVLILSIVSSVFIIYILYLQSGTSKMSVESTNFEVFGRVQGVFFRKHLKTEADRLGVKGWCMNTKYGTVVGYIEGSPEVMPIIMKWLQEKGSPSSVIEKCVFSGQTVKLDHDYLNFEIRHPE